jgi:voltage-gated sodium channel
MQTFFQKISDHSGFQNFILGVIVAAGILVGFETYPSIVASHGHTLHFLDRLVLGIFVLEIVVKTLALGSKPWRYFSDPWNCFDFAIVVACFLPFEGQAVTVLRLLRLLRVLRLVHALPKLQVLVGALLKSIPSMAYVSLFLGLLFYVYAVAGVFLFGKNDPLHFATLRHAMLSLFQVVTLEAWVDVMNISVYGCNKVGYDTGSLVACTHPMAQPTVAVAYFISFILFGTMIILNLFIGVIMNGMEEAQAEAARDAELRKGLTAPSLGDELVTLRKQLSVVEAHLAHLQQLHPPTPVREQSAAE